jgi:hypothetical protein
MTNVSVRPGKHAKLTKDSLLMIMVTFGTTPEAMTASIWSLGPSDRYDKDQAESTTVSMSLESRSLLKAGKKCPTTAKSGGGFFPRVKLEIIQAMFLTKERCQIQGTDEQLSHQAEKTVI